MRLSREETRLGTALGLYTLLALIFTPAALAALVCRFLLGSNMRRLAHAVIIAGLYAGLDLASIWSFADLRF